MGLFYALGLLYKFGLDDSGKKLANLALAPSFRDRARLKRLSVCLCAHQDLRVDFAGFLQIARHGDTRPDPRLHRQSGHDPLVGPLLHHSRHRQDHHFGPVLRQKIRPASESPTVVAGLARPGLAVSQTDVDYRSESSPHCCHRFTLFHHNCFD